jgi:hypothetical protein
MSTTLGIGGALGEGQLEEAANYKHNDQGRKLPEETPMALHHSLEF